jgi:ABC-type sugar transport system ATPase subunit
MNTKTLLKVVHVSKGFPGVKALSDVSLDVNCGEVHVLIGENGAGKSTLIKMIAGIYSIGSGEIFFKGEKVHFKSPYDAINAGISVIPQELSIVDDLTVAENIFLGREKKRGKILLDKESTKKEAQSFFDKYDIGIDVNRLVATLSTAEKQMVEILRAVSWDASLIIMDEPTASLSDVEVKELFKIIRNLKDQNIGIIYISHRLKELFKIGDRITILRDGELVKTTDVSEVNTDQVVSLMVGRKINNYYNRRAHSVGTEVLRVSHLSEKNHFTDVSFALKRGEILGISGLVGAGRSELIETVFGARKANSGEVFLKGKKVNFHSPQDAIRHGFGLVPEERRTEGLIVDDSVEENISLPSLVFTKVKGLLNRTWIKSATQEQIKRLSIKTPSGKTITKYLSGGNQQKIVLGKWFARKIDYLLLDEPTRGIDVNAKAEIYSLIFDFVSNGGSVVMVSSELPELLGICDRILVMREGAVSGEFLASEATEKAIMEKACI